MDAQTDQQLLRDYAGSHSESAFAELVRRHIDLVYSAALRMVCDSHQAEDVTQGVFVALAQNARQLTQHPVLSGWLHRTAQNLAANAIRTDVRRRAREQEAAVMNELLSAEPDMVWELIAPHLDAALGELSETERDALLLRYFESKSAREIAQTLGTSEDAAQKRVSRAVEHLREFFAERGVTVGASGLAVVIAANAVQAAPIGLAGTITTAAAVTGTTIVTTATATATKAIAMTTLQKALVTATLVAAVGTGIYEARRASRLRNQVQTLQEQQKPLVEQIQQLRRERDEASNRLEGLLAENSRSQSIPNQTELLQLRGEVTRLRAASQELAKLTSGETDPRELEAKKWLHRVDLLKQRLEQTPEARIPEFEFLTERNWLDVVKNYDLANETEFRQAFSQLRSVAESIVARRLQAAMKKYSEANDGRYASDLTLLNPYLESPLSDSILQRYVVYPGDTLQTIKLGGDWLITLKEPIDLDFDARLAVGPNGSGSVSFNKSELVDILAPAIKAYAAANGGKMPSDPAQIEPYASTSEQQAALRRAVELLKAEGK